MENREPQTFQSHAQEKWSELPGLLAAGIVAGLGIALVPRFGWLFLLPSLAVFYFVNKAWNGWKHQQLPPPVAEMPPPEAFDIPARVQFWRTYFIEYFVQHDANWLVLFAYDTCVVCGESADPVAAGQAILRELGPAHAGTVSADFSVHALANDEVVVSYPDPRVFTYVRAKLSGPHEEAITGLLGRMGRDWDIATLQVVHHCRWKD